MKWLFVEIQGDSVIFRCSVCNSEISVKQGEELPYCKHCENEPDGELFNEVVKALEEWIKALKDDYKRLQLLDAPMDCFEESHTDNIRLLTNALDLIKRKDEQIESLIAGQETLQKYIAEKDTEIEKLQKENTELDGANILLTVTLQNAKSEAVKEFAERLKEKAKANEWNGTICGLDIDNLVEEMVGEG